MIKIHTLLSDIHVKSKTPYNIPPYFARNVGDNELLIEFYNHIEASHFLKYVKNNNECPFNDTNNLCKHEKVIRFLPNSTTGHIRETEDHEIYFVCSSPQAKNTLVEWLDNNILSCYLKEKDGHILELNHTIARGLGLEFGELLKNPKYLVDIQDRSYTYGYQIVYEIGDEFPPAIRGYWLDRHCFFDTYYPTFESLMMDEGDVMSNVNYDAKLRKVKMDENTLNHRFPKYTLV